MKKELATLGVALAGLVAAARAGDAAQESICIPLAQLRKVRADVFANVEDAMKDPHGKGPALILHAKRNFDSLEFVGKANVTKTKNNNEKNKADARRLSSCVDYPGWVDNFNAGCSFYTSYLPCGGDQAWPYGLMGAYTDSSGHSAEDACCACGGGTGGTGGTPVEKHPDFVAIEEAISNAPSNGVETIVGISGRSIPWAALIRIPKGKNIVLNGINTKMQVGLDAGGTTRHFYVEEGASLSAINVAFKNGKGSNGGAIYSKGTIARLDNVVFEGNTATQRGGAVLLHGSGSSLGNVAGCTFRGNRALESGAGIYIEKSHLTSMSITTTTFVDNKCDNLDLSFGGAIYFNTVTGNIGVVKDSHFLNNWARDGGAVRFESSSSVVFSSSLFENNVGTGAGGALAVFDTTVDLIHNCTFVRNRADDTLASGYYLNVSHLFYFL